MKDVKRCVTRAGDKVRFHISDVFLPSPGAIFAPLEEETEMEGTVVNFSDSGSKLHFFAVVEVVKTQSLIVPVEKLEIIDASGGEDKT